MDQPTARRLLSEGAFFIFLGVPEGTEFGIDMKCWNTAEKFRGVKMIPPGIHFIFYSSISTTEDKAPRVGFFYNFKKGEVVVRKWDRVNEQISTEPVSELEIVSFKENILALDGFLGPYPYDILDKWKSLSYHLSDEILNKLNPKSGQVNSALQLQSCSDKDRPRGIQQNRELYQPSTTLLRKRLSKNFEDVLLPELKPLEGTALQLTAFPEKNFPEGSTPSEITKHSLDLTFVFETMLIQYESLEDILGELEFSYICFLVGHSLEAFDQWKKLVTLFCSCDVAVSKYRKIFDAFISVVEIHIREIPEEFLADIASSVDGQLKRKAERLRKELTDLYFWDFDHLDSEEEDEAPVIVRTS